jgi:hypothetical protein
MASLCVNARQMWNATRVPSTSSSSSSSSRGGASASAPLRARARGGACVVRDANNEAASSSSSSGGGSGNDARGMNADGAEAGQQQSMYDFDMYVGDERAFSAGAPGKKSTFATTPELSLDEEFKTLIRARKVVMEAETRKRWNEGAATPKVAFDLGRDYIRRVAVAYPYAVVGSARGDVAVCDVSKSAALAISPAAHRRDWSEVESRPLGERVLLGQYDGGAVTAVGITLVQNGSKFDFARVASGGRDGVVHLYKAATNSAALVEQGQAQHAGVVTGITFTRGSLWSTALDGRLCRWSLIPPPVAVASTEHERWKTEDASAYAKVPPPMLAKQGEWSTGQPSLSLSSCDKSGIIAVGNADGTAAILSAEASSFDSSRASNMLTWKAHEGSTVRSIAQCPGNGIVTGGGDGIIRVWRLSSKPSSPAFDSHPGTKFFISAESTKPELVAELRGHTGAVVSLSCGCDGRLVSGAHDGTIRVWDLDLTKNKPGEKIKTIRRDARYAVLGHTVWLGSTYADAERIICDGANNVLLEYDFTAQADDADM